MIIGLGMDLVELDRIEKIYNRRGNIFVDRVCQPGECEVRKGAALIQHLGGLFAAKEAGLKALGTGWAKGLTLRQVEVTKNDAGQPGLVFHGAALERADAIGLTHCHVTITHERRYASAVVVIENNSGPMAQPRRLTLEVS